MYAATRGAVLRRERAQSAVLESPVGKRDPDRLTITLGLDRWKIVAGLAPFSHPYDMTVLNHCAREDMSHLDSPLYLLLES